MFSPVDTVCQNLPLPAGRISCYSYSILQEEPRSVVNNRSADPYVEILEQPISIGARFRYKCEGRSAGCIRGINSTDKQKTYPTIKVHGYQGAVGVVVSCVTKDGPPYYPHPHNLVGKTCTNGVCYKSINTPDMICSFSNLGIQCVKKKDIKESLLQREAIQVDPFGTGFSHHSEPSKINLNALRLCFQVFLPDENGKLCIPLPVEISNPIYDNKTVSASPLTICKLSHCSALVTGGQEIILLCDQINKDDIQILFYEECDNKIIWRANGKFGPHHVHRKAAISFQTPPYKSVSIQQSVDCFIQLRRPSDGAVGKPVNFTFVPLTQDPEGMARKRNKFEALRLDRILLPSNLPSAISVAVPRPVKQAVRSKNIPSGTGVDYQRNFVPALDYQMPSSLVHENAVFIEGMNNLSHPPSQCDSVSSTIQSGNVQITTSPQKVEDFLTVAKQQINTNNNQTYVETTSEENLDKLSSLDLGIDPNDLDVNLSGITLDSFSES